MRSIYPSKLMFSIIIPVFNRLELLQRAINSVIKQTSQTFEVIIVDDGSTVDIDSVVRKLNSQDIKYIRIPRMGASAARNIGIALAKHEWIAFLDSDDWWPEDKLEIFNKFITANPHVDVFCSGLTYFNE